MSPEHTDETPRPADFSPQSLMPVVIFLVVNRLVGLRWAVVAATIWSVKVLVDRRRRKLPLGRFVPIVTVAVLLRGAIGAVTGSETVYFGLGIATKYAAAVVLAGSILVRRPLAALAAPYLIAIPPGLPDNRIYRSTMSIATGIAALYYVVSASLDVWLYRRSSVEGYVVLRFLANWPLGLIAMSALFITLQRRLRQIPGLAPLNTLMEERFESLRPYSSAPPTTTSGDTSAPSDPDHA